MDKDFNTWNFQKQKLHLSDNSIIFYEREVWWTRVGVNVGVEIDGKNRFFLRPVIIIRKFNRDMALVIPTTTKNKANKFYLDTAGENERGYRACLSQIRVMSAKRLVRKTGKIKKEDYSKLLNKVAQMMYGVL